MENPTLASFSSAEIETLHAMWRRGLNAPLCSSVGRLFDAVASLTGTRQSLGYEGESGLLLESAAAGTDAPQALPWRLNGEVIDWEPMVRALLASEDRAQASAGFHAAVAEIIAAIASRHPEKPVVLSGGVFQNRTLVKLAGDKLRSTGVTYYLQIETPVNDGGIALGQLYHALFREKHE
jgi:hydrogenase maturation protein HypF